MLQVLVQELRVVLVRRTTCSARRRGCPRRKPIGWTLWPIVLPCPPRLWLCGYSGAIHGLARPRGPARKRCSRVPSSAIRRLDPQRVRRKLVVVLRVRRGRLHDLLDLAARPASAGCAGSRPPRRCGRPLSGLRIRRTLRGEMRTFLPLAVTSTTSSVTWVVRSDAAGVAAEGARQGELAETVPDHVLGDEDRHVAAAVVHGDGQADHLGHDRRGARPGADARCARRCARRPRPSSAASRR